MAIVGILQSKFTVKGGQPLQLEGDVLAIEVVWATLVEDKEEATEDLQQDKTNDKVEVMKFEKPQLVQPTFMVN